MTGLTRRTFVQAAATAGVLSAAKTAPMADVKIGLYSITSRTAASGIAATR